MSKEQIKKLTGVLWGNPYVNIGSYDADMLAQYLHNEGYRKQSVGKWKKRTIIIFDSEIVGYKCSECNTTWDTETKFCPNCGANMGLIE